MPLEPLRFDTFANVRKSLARINRLGLISIEIVKPRYTVKVNERLSGKLPVLTSTDKNNLERLRKLGATSLDTLLNSIDGDAHSFRKSLLRLKESGLISIEIKIASHQMVKVKEALANELLVSTNGDTYLLSDVLNLSDEEAVNMDVTFARKNNENRIAESVIRNRPLAEALSTLKFNEKSFFLKLKQTRLFPFPTVFPVITQDEETEEALKAKDYQSYCIANDNNNNPYPVLVPNNALEQIYTYSSKSKEQLENYKLGLHAISYHHTLSIHHDYKKDIAEHPEFENKNADDVLRIAQKYEKNIGLIKKASMPIGILLTFAVTAALVAIAWPVAPIAALVMLVTLGIFTHHLNSKINEKNAIANAVIAYKNAEKDHGDINSLQSKLSRKEAVINKQSPKVETPAQPKLGCGAAVSAHFARLFKPAKRIRRVKLAEEAVQNDVPEVFAPNNDDRLMQYRLHR